MESSSDEMWEWADQQASAVPAWSEERWRRANAIFGIRLAAEVQVANEQEAA